MAKKPKKRVSKDYGMREAKPAPAKPDAARVIADLADATHDKRAAPPPKSRVQAVPGRPGEYVQDFGGVGGIVDRIAGRRNARDQSEGIY